jgi:lactate dehydrogenase-like 2-hydroxyacid dehydrogenase/phosphoserine aminotransferase
VKEEVRKLQAARDESLAATAGGPPPKTINPFFGVGPITDMASDEADSRQLRFAFERWLEENYRKLDDKGRDIGCFTAAEIGRSMHRGYPADKFLIDMMRDIHRYFEFPKQNRLAVGLGGGHSGFTVAALHFLTVHDAAQHVFVDTPAPESDAAKASGFFRQSWGAQIVEMMRHGKGGDEARIHFAKEEGTIPSSDLMERMGIKVFFGVGHETTGATTYSKAEILNLLDWIDRNPAEHHAVLDATSMLGAMPWGEDVVAQVMAKCCLFMPFQKAIGGISGYFLVSFTPEALALVEENQKRPSWAIPRQLKLAAPADPKLPLSGDRSVKLGPFYDPAEDRMLGGVINTFSTLAFAETRFGLLRVEKMIGPAKELNRRSELNRKAINEWMSNSALFELGVAKPENRGAAVTLIRVKDKAVTDAALHARIIARSKQLLSYDGITHPNGVHEEGLDAARYVNAFPGTPGDYRAWIGGIRPVEDITALLDNIKYAYHRARIVVMEEELAKHGVSFPAPEVSAGRSRRDDPARAYKVLVCDHVGLKFGKDGKPDYSAVRAHIEAEGGVFHEGPLDEGHDLAAGRIHFFYQPDLSRPDEIRPLTDKGQYDAVIAAATFLPKESVFREGGVRIGAGTGNMGSASWGGGNGEGGMAPLMNTPSFNSRATAQMAMKALLKVLPDLPVEEMHRLTAAGSFDTGRDLKNFPTEKIEGKRMAIIGYGNIGREMAKLAQAFGMEVAVHARPRHKEWIESEGFIFAPSPEDAARGADVISVHTGLGPLNAATGKHANANVVNAAVLAAVRDGAILLNYDRGECVDAAALDEAMAAGKIRHAAIDADLFVDAAGKATGPMAPYLPLAEKYPGRLELLPHAAADTEHVSRVEGAKQAVDQIMSAIRYREVVNLKGDLPEGYSVGGAMTVAGVGKCSGQTIARALAAEGAAEAARGGAEAMAAIWGALATANTEERRKLLIERHGAALTRHFNAYATLMRKLGIEGPYM